MQIIEAFVAKKNVYFDYEFNHIELDGSFPETIYQSLMGELFKHVIEYPDVHYCIYCAEQLQGDELEKLKQDWMCYCPLVEA